MLLAIVHADRIWLSVTKAYSTGAFVLTETLSNGNSYLLNSSSFTVFFPLVPYT